MNAYPCPKGHNSIESDYCSECGAKIPAVSGAVSQLSQPDQPIEAQASSSSSATDLCPVCGALREIAGLAFCEICGWDFANGPAIGTAVASVSASDSVAGTTPAMAPEGLPANSAAEPNANWTVTIEVDPLLRQQSSPFPLTGIVPLTLPLNQPVSLIGRRSEARAVFPEIALAYDDAVSHRHALLQIDGNGALLLRDIGSSNGTRLNGQETTPMQDYPLHDGDQITLGHFTRISVKAIR